MTTHNARRLIVAVSGVAMAACLTIATWRANAQSPGTDPGDKATTRGVSTTTGTTYAGGDSYVRTAPTRWADALYDDIQPNEPNIVQVWTARAKKPREMTRLVPVPPASFRLTALGETVLRLSLSALTHTDKLADPTLAVEARVDGGPATLMTFKAKRFKAVTVGRDSTWLLSEEQDLYLPLAEGAHVIDVVDAGRDTSVTVVAMFAVPSGEPPR